MSYSSGSVIASERWCGGSELAPQKETSGQWYAIYTSTRHEKSVSTHFQMREIDFYLPIWTTQRKWKNGCTVQLQLPLFPNYLFAKFEQQERSRVLGVPGVLSIVGVSREGTPLEASDIEKLKSSVDLCRVTPHHYLSVGEKVRITTGPLTGFEGMLVREKSESRVVISLDFIQRSMAVELDSIDIEPVGPRSAIPIQSASDLKQKR